MKEELLMDLQWFAAEDEGRTHEPTETTYRKAREEGRVAKSQDLISALGLLLPAVAIFFLAPGMLRTCAEMLRFFFLRVNELDPISDAVVAGVFFRYFIRLAAPVLAVAVVSAFFANYIQVGFLFTTKPLVPDFSKVLPKFGRYFQKTLGSVEGLFNFGKSIFKMAFIGIAAFLIIRSRIEQLTNLQTMDLWTAIVIIASTAARMMITCALLLLLLSIPDFFYQRWQFRESLKMTREQAKEELKQEEGDPQVRSRLKRRYQELLNKDLSRVVPQADVVITNPTHYSVALLYEPERMEGPTVIAKGEDDLAFRIREIARVNEVPVVSHPPLTRIIYAETEVGDMVPVKYWQVMILLLGKFFTAGKKSREPARMEA
ncbi:MAG: EscU/YscU/HrcU family type III secretion system export apparatus switch protein [Treponema sp.]|jgi:flagellar biosynthetic protein FlhB|nr:EscU/YscU/HrcU family type III secretion system export apparatus switch protein [Treponema sp.]